MPIRLESEDMEFVLRVQSLCREGRSEPEIAAVVGMSTSGLRTRLMRFGLVIGKQTTREIVRAGSYEPLPALMERGEVITADTNGHAPEPDAEGAVAA